MEFRITGRTALLLFFDIAATYAAYWLASVLTNVLDEVFVNNEIYFILGILAFFNVAVLGVMRLYNNLWEYASIDEALQIVISLALSTLGGAVFLWVIDVRLPIRVFFVSFFLLIFLCGGMRMVYRHKEIDRARFERYRKRFSPYCSIASLYFWAVSGGALPELTDPAALKPKK